MSEEKLKRFDKEIVELAYVDKDGKEVVEKFIPLRLVEEVLKRK